MITNEIQARRHAEKYLQHNTLVVGEKGDIHGSCDIDEVCKSFEEKGEKFFIVNGERIIKKVKVKKDDIQAE